jgi:monoamine oxidase
VCLTPEPERTFASVRGLEVGRACKVVLQFRERFWAQICDGELKDMGFLFSPGTIPPVWWTQYPDGRPVLTAWSGGPNSDQMLAMMSRNPELELTKALAATFAIPQDYLRGILLRCDTHDWQADPFARGAYSYVPAGGLQAIRQLSEPVEDTLFFAGEHTDSTGHWGTVHGALLSGMRAASQLLKSDIRPERG